MIFIKITKTITLCALIATICSLTFAQQDTENVVVTTSISETPEKKDNDDSIIITNDDVADIVKKDGDTENETVVEVIESVGEEASVSSDNAKDKPIPLEFIVNDRAGFGPRMAIIVNPEEEVKILPVPPDQQGSIGMLSPPDQLSLAPKKYTVSQGDSFTWNLSAGRVVKFLERGIIWESPLRSGTEKVDLIWDIERSLIDKTTQETTRELERATLKGVNTMHALIRFPFNPVEQTSIEGYSIGVYPDPEMPDVEQVSPYVAEYKEYYKAPEWFVKVDESNAELFVSPHFRLGDFSPAQERGKTHFIVLDYRLLDRLESILAKVREKNSEVRDLTILRAYLSPNQRDLLRVKGVEIKAFSRHIYGDAAAFIVDADGDGVMDDLNGDEAIDIHDAEYLEGIIDEIERQSGVYGGVGMLATFVGPEHDKETPCVMVDTRGVRSRWRVE